MVYDFGLADFMIRFLWQSLISYFFLRKKYKTKGSKFKISFSKQCFKCRDVSLLNLT